MDDLGAWRLALSRQSGLGHATKVKVYSPGCPAVPHAERDCRCRTFGTRGIANEYVANQSRIDSETE